MAAKRHKIKKYVAATLAIFAGFVYLHNTSLLADPIGSQPVLLAHRGLAQGYSKEGLNNETCTAAQMIRSDHDYLENTIASMEAAFAQGANIVEFDVHQTTDNKFAVFHDWTVDCRTEGKGVTREQSLEELQALDIGYGYTDDGGKTWPFRGKGVGLMPSMAEVLTKFPDQNFLIDVKSNEPEEGKLLAERLAALPPERAGKIMVYGGPEPINKIRERLPNMQTISRPRLKKCLTRYLALGWSGYVHPACKTSVLMVPVNYAPWMWGWPNRFLQRMDAVGTKVFLVGEYKGEGFSQGVDDVESLQKLPQDYSGGIWTDKIDVIGPEVEEGEHFRN